MNDKADGVAEIQATLQKEVIRPITEYICAQIKVTGFLGYQTTDKFKEYIAAIESLVIALDKTGVNIRLRQMNDLEQATLLKTIVEQIKLHLKIGQKCCSTVTYFFKPAMNPEQLRSKTPAIVAGVKASLSNDSLPDLEQSAASSHVVPDGANDDEDERKTPILSACNGVGDSGEHNLSRPLLAKPQNKAAIPLKRLTV